MSARRAAGCFAPFSTPTNSTCRKQPSRHDADRRDLLAAWLAYTTSAGGLDAYDTTIGRSPLPPPAVKSPSYAWSQPSSTTHAVRAQLASSSPATRSSPYAAIVASRKRARATTCAAFSTTVRFLYAGLVRSASEAAGRPAVVAEPRLVVVDAHVAVVDRRAPDAAGRAGTRRGTAVEPRGAYGVEDARVERARLRNVLSTPNSASATGWSFVRIAWFSVAPASPGLQQLDLDTGLRGERREHRLRHRERVVRSAATHRLVHGLARSLDGPPLSARPHCRHGDREPRDERSPVSMSTRILLRRVASRAAHRARARRSPSVADQLVAHAPRRARMQRLAVAAGTRSPVGDARPRAGPPTASSVTRSPGSPRELGDRSRTTDARRRVADDRLEMRGRAKSGEREQRAGSRGSGRGARPRRRRPRHVRPPAGWPRRRSASSRSVKSLSAGMRARSSRRPRSPPRRSAGSTESKSPTTRSTCEPERLAPDAARSRPRRRPRRRQQSRRAGTASTGSPPASTTA